MFRSSISCPVLHHGDDAARLQAILPVLHARNVGSDHSLCGFGIFAERSVHTWPSWFRGEVGLRGERLPDSDGNVLLPDYVAEPARQLGVIYRRKAQRLRPLRECRALHAGSQHLLEVMTGVGGDGDRYAPT